MNQTWRVCSPLLFTKWSQLGHAIPIGTDKQLQWDEISCAASFATLRSQVEQHHVLRACLPLAQPHCGDWILSIPSSATGTLLDNDSLRTGIALRLALQLCQQHKCHCGQVVDKYGLHPLSCRLSARRIPRHTAINDIVRRALDTAGIPSLLEPVGLDRGDGKRPDGITVFPFQNGRSMIWDATPSDTFSADNVTLSPSRPVTIAIRAEDRKKTKYSALSDRFVFVPVSVETAGVLGPETRALFNRLGSVATSRSGDARETAWLYQRLSLAVLRGNHFSIISAGLYHGINVNSTHGRKPEIKKTATTA